jgi:hypothetical protein
MKPDPLLAVKELAEALRRDRTYVWAMKCRGFAMPGGRARLSDALIWLEKHPEPRSRNPAQQHATSAV